MCNQNNLNEQQAIVLHKQINYDLLVRTVVRLSPNLTSELEKSAKEFLQINEQETTEGNQELADMVKIVANTLANKIHAENQKESNHE